MKTIQSQYSKESFSFVNFANLLKQYSGLSLDIAKPKASGIQEIQYPKELLTTKAIYQMMAGQIPDLWHVCMSLYGTFQDKLAPYSAMQFVKVLQQMPSLKPTEIERFINNEETNHVLIQNEWLKVVLIHWKPGKHSSIHGHPSGGCVFKVLQGTLEEKRYTTEGNPKLLSTSICEKNSMAYIDDGMAYHSVGNTSNTSAVSIHIYTPGIKK